MAANERVTVTLPGDLLRDIDRRDRSKFVAEAVRREIGRRRNAGLKRSLQNPHPEGTDLAEQGLAEWSRNLPEEDTAALLHRGAGKAIRWIPDEGWVEDGA